MARPVTVQIVIDGDNANTASTVMGYSRLLVAAFGAAQLSALESRLPVPTITVEPRIWYNPQLRSTLFLVPGLIAYISMITAVVSTALSIVREKERGTMEQVRMAPVNPVSYIVGKTLPYLAISFISAILIILTAMVLFDLPMRGSWLLLCAAIGLFLVGAQAQGLLISTIAQTQQVAFQIALLSSFLPTFILSGFIFPISSMPPVVQAITHIVPARYFLVALRAIVLKGAGIDAFWEQMVALALFGTIALALASLRLKREWS
jgi:ABC-2 type transport system permease protein